MAKSCICNPRGTSANPRCPVHHGRTVGRDGVIKSVVVDHPGHPVAAPCAIEHCKYFELHASGEQLSKEYHAAINEPEYAGTRADWIHRAQVAESEVERLKHQIKLMQQQADRDALCPDHRDKFHGRCAVCAVEERERQR